MGKFKIFLLICSIVLGINSVEGYTSSTHSWSSNSGNTNCSSGTPSTSGQVATSGSFSCVSYCGTDLYYSSGCRAVGTGYYSPSGNDSRYSCSNKPSNNSSRSYYYTSDGNGSNNCSYSYNAACGTDTYETSVGTCSGVGTGYYSPSGNNSRYSCTNKPSNNTSRSYYYTSDGNGGNSCSYSYSDRCGTDRYESSNGTCSAVGTGNYSPSGNNSRYSCTNAPSDNSSRNYYYTSDGNGGNSCGYSYAPLCGTDRFESVNGVCSLVSSGQYSPSSNNSRYNCTNLPGNTASRNYYYTGRGSGTSSCPYTYSDRCGIDLYESSNGTCSAVGTGRYSPNSNNGRYSCSNKPAYSYYTGDGGGSNSCPWTCISGYSRSGNTCVDSAAPTGSITSYTPSGWTNSTVTVTASCSDSGSGCSSSTFSKTVSSNGSGYVTISDNAGNTANIPYNVTNIDKIVPVGNVSHNTGWYNNSQTISFSASDSGGSRLKRIRLQESVNGGSYQYIAGTNYDNLNATGTVSRTYTRSAVNGNSYRYRLIAWDYTGQYGVIYGPSSPVMFDTGAPGLPVISSSTHTNNVWTNVDDASFTLTKGSNGPSPSTNYYCNDTSNSCNPTTAGNSRSLSNLSNGVHYFRAKTCDTGGCGGVRSFTIRIDKTLPTGTITYVPNTWTNGNVTVNIACSDTYSGCNMYDITGWTKSTNTYSRTFTTNTSGSITLRDIAGNQRIVNYNVNKIDKTSPTVSANYSNTTLWRNSKVNITLSVGDTGGSNVSIAKYRWDNNNCWSGTNFTNGSTIQVPNEGTHTLYLCAGDTAGNTAVWNGVYKYDSTIPVVTDDYAFDNIWTNTGRTITLSPSDPKGPDHSNLTTTKYCWGNGCLPVTGTTGTSIVVTGQINNVLRYQTYDNAGNSSNIGVIYVKVDTTSPVLSANNSHNTLWRNTKVNITLSVSDSGGSGVSYARYRWDNSGCTTGTNFTNGTIIQVPSEGTHTLYLCTSDVAGNTTTWNGIYKYDATIPVVTDDYTFDNIWTNTTNTINFTSTDPNGPDHSNINNTKYCWGAGCNPNSGTIANSITVGPDRNNILRYRTYDIAGNESNIGQIVVRIEDNYPATTISFMAGGNVYNSGDWTNQNVSAIINCTDTTDTINSGCDTSSYQYRIENSNFACNNSGTWDTATSFSITALANQNRTAYVCSRVRDIAGNGYSYSPVYEINIDKVTPTDSDITASDPVANSKFFATANRNFDITAGVNGGSPIAKIEGYFENYNTTDSLETTLLESDADNNPANTGILSVNKNISDVDRDRDSRGYRQYTFRITRVVDEAGNVFADTTNGVKNFYYYVFADTNNMNADVTTNQLDDSGNIADGTPKQLTIRLEDQFGNEIVPASDINRNISFDFDVTNNLRLNQYSLTVNDDAIFLDRPNNPGIFSNRFGSSNVTFSNEPSTDGTYTYNFKVYTPTFDTNASNGREWANGEAFIDAISYNIDQNPSTYIQANQNGGVDLGLGGAKIEFVYAPLYTAEFIGDLNQQISGNGAIQNSRIDVQRNSGVSVSNQALYLGFGQTSGSDNVAHPNYSFTYDPNGGSEVEINEGHQTNVNTLHNLGNLSDKNFDVKIELENGPVDQSLATYVSSHISYRIDGKNVVYDSHTINKPRYVDGTNLANTRLVGLKVLGKIQSKNQQDITTGQSGTDLYQLGNNTKSDLKEQIRKNVSEVIRNATIVNAGNVLDLSNATWPAPQVGTKLLNDSVLYFDNLSGNNIEIGNGALLRSRGVKTIIVKGGNVYIRSNIEYYNTSQDMLGIIALEDDNGNGGNIYIHPSVTHVSAVMYGDKSFISYNGSEIGAGAATAQLKNQLYIYGTLFTENTIGGSVNPLRCPYYISDASCDFNTAKKYDLNFMRRYFIQDDGTPYDNGQSYYPSGHTNYEFPMIIEYNPNVQNTPPPLFDVSEE